MDDRKRSNIITDVAKLKRQLPEVAAAISSTGGACGVSGVPGACGVSGVAGTAGACGVSGISGVSGTTGAAGACGISGVAGIAGACGVSGTTGSVGSAGACGVSGVAGACGVSGTTGSAGAAGACGVSGVSGVSGVPGTQWRGAFASSTAYVLNDIVSSAGSTYICILGYTSSATLPAADPTNWALYTSVGACGVSGVSGITGVPGTAGACGVSGTAGTAGACGVSGVAGACGVSGTTGGAGACGVSGTAGAAGACGVSGVAGVAGACGVSGVAGTNGACGVSGVSGVQGAAGGAASWLGPWVTATPYVIDDIVSNGGSSWLCILGHTSGASSEPGVGGSYATYWILVAQKGACGVSGTAGTNGACGVSGIAGACGVSGTAGTNGTNGACGVSGVSGVTGVPGTNGACGVSGTGGACGVSGVASAAGMIQPFAMRTAPAGWLNCDGSAVSRSTYAGLFAVLASSLGTFTVTSATPAVVTRVAHGLSTGDQVYLTTTGALYTGLTVNTLYYVIRTGADTFNLATSRANAYAGTKINTSGSQSGTHTLWDCPYGLGDGSTTFTLPDFRGRTLAGMDTTAGTAANRLTLPETQGAYGNLGSAGGVQDHTLTGAESGTSVHGHGITDPGHAHTIVAYTGGVNGGEVLLSNNSGNQNRATASAVTSITVNNSSAANASNAHNNVQPTQLVNYIIKT